MKIWITVETEEAEINFHNNDGELTVYGKGDGKAGDKIREACEQANDLIENTLKGG